MSKSKPQLKSPCIRMCSLNEDDICVGCYRTVQEIGQWGGMNKSSQQAVMKKVRERETKYSLLSDE